MTKQLPTWRNTLQRTWRGDLGATFCLAIMLAGPGCQAEEADPNDGLTFLITHQKLGTMTSGEVREVIFSFTVGQVAVTPHNFETSCGCLDARFLVNGELHPLGTALAADTHGELHVEWRTEGFEGLRESIVRVLGVGPGLPANLGFSAELEPWFTVESGPVFHLGVIDGEKRQSFEVRVTAPEPFQLLDVLAGLPPLEIEGLPTPKAATEQRFTVILPAGEAEEGPHRGFLQLRTDQEYALTVPLDYTVERELWVQPAKRLLLGALPPGRPSTGILEVGARQGQLKKPAAIVTGIPGASIVVVTLEDQKRYQLRVDLPGGLASGPVKGTIYLQLQHLHQGRERTVERVIQLLGIVSDGR